MSIPLTYKNFFGAQEKNTGLLRDRGENMKKILILTCSTGEGHNSAAYAVQEALQRQGAECELKDPVSFQSERMQHFVASLYNNTIKKTPHVFGAVYKLGRLYSDSGLPSPVYWANAHYSEPLKQYILDQKFDAVVCTHLYGMEAMSAVLKDTKFTVPCSGILTDYTCIPFLDETQLHDYFVPTESVRQFMLEKGKEKDHVFVTGIPVSSTFSQPPERAAARRTLQIPPDRKVFLIMTGGIGCENMVSLCKVLMAKLKSDSQVFVLAGRNEKLKSRLREMFPDMDRLSTIPFTRQVALYMAAADVMLSKPGGLSSTEAAVANVPLVHVHAIPGCETFNAEFFSQNGLSLAAHSNEEAAEYAIRLATHSEEAKKMRACQRKFVPKDAADTIARKVLSQC